MVSYMTLGKSQWKRFEIAWIIKYNGSVRKIKNIKKEMLENYVYLS